jgi:hypothetical protein
MVTKAAEDRGLATLMPRKLYQLEARRLYNIEHPGKRNPVVGKHFDCLGYRGRTKIAVATIVGVATSVFGSHYRARCIG